MTNVHTGTTIAQTLSESMCYFCILSHVFLHPIKLHKISSKIVIPESTQYREDGVKIRVWWVINEDSPWNTVLGLEGMCGPRFLRNMQFVFKTKKMCNSFSKQRSWAFSYTRSSGFTQKNIFIHVHSGIHDPRFLRNKLLSSTCKPLLDPLLYKQIQIKTFSSGFALKMWCDYAYGYGETKVLYRQSIVKYGVQLRKVEDKVVDRTARVQITKCWFTYTVQPCESYWAGARLRDIRKDSIQRAG